MTQEHQTSISSRNGTVTSTEPPLSATDISEWESRMAKLVGLEEETKPSNSQISNSQIQETQETPTEDRVTDPNSVRTKQSLSANPFAKAGLVGASTLAVVVFAGAFLSQIMGGGGKQPVNKNTTIKPPSEPKSPPRLQQLETEVETLKTKLALEKQAEAVKAAQQQLRNTKPQSEVARKPSPPKPPTPVKNVSPPEIITRVVREPQPAPEPQQTQPAPPPPPPPAPPAPPEKPDPMQEWQRLAKLGSYGMVTQDISKQNTIASAPTTKPKPPVESKPELKPKPIAPVVSQRRRRNTKSTVIGSNAEAVIATAIFGETTKSRGKNNKDVKDSSQNDNVFVVRLREPLKARDGEVVVPKGSEILTKLSSISDSGLVELNVTKVLLRGENGLIERNITPNALTIRAPKGKPLIAKNYSDKGSSIARRDAASFVLGGVGRTAQLFNRTQTRIVREDGETFSETNDDDPNIAAGILEGGIGNVIPQINRRNQQAISQLRRKTNVWLLKEGKKVEVYVNQEIQF